jgi:ubiquitin-protein ligase
VDPRDRRLEADTRKVRELTENSDLIEAKAIGAVPGRPPESWEITYRCRGIVGKNADNSPIYGDYHRVRLDLGREYPRTPPMFQWLTPIVHPNIEGHEPYRVCIDQAHWQPGHHLDSVILMIGEMVQYKNYHAEDSPPYALDAAAAAWARWAESAGYFSKSSPVDPRPLLRPGRGAPAIPTPVPSARSRVRVVATAPTPATPTPRSRVRITDGR